jgi:hypothetical protein
MHPPADWIDETGKVTGKPGEIPEWPPDEWPPKQGTEDEVDETDDEMAAVDAVEGEPALVADQADASTAVPATEEATDTAPTDDLFTAGLDAPASQQADIEKEPAAEEEPTPEGEPTAEEKLTAADEPAVELPADWVLASEVVAPELDAVITAELEVPAAATAAFKVEDAASFETKIVEVPETKGVEVVEDRGVEPIGATPIEIPGEDDTRPSIVGATPIEIPDIAEETTVVDYGRVEPIEIVFEPLEEEPSDRAGPLVDRVEDDPLDTIEEDDLDEPGI